MIKHVLRSLFLAASVLLTACASHAPAPREPMRTMGVSRGPELVFAQPVDELMPILQGATATGRNGRVGGELVFWSYRLADGRDVLLQACAALEGIDCAARSQRVCPAGLPQPLQGLELSGEVRHLHCRPVGQAAPGDLRPNCTDLERTSPLQVAVVAYP